MKIGYFLSSEEWGPGEQLEQARMAEEAGFEALWISDHYHPWNGAQGNSPFVWSVIGGLSQVTSRAKVVTAVTCPTMRIHPAVMAQAAATSAVMLPGRFEFGVGSGEALNEHIFGDAWPSADVRLEMLEEAIEIIRLLWEGGTKDHEGKHYVVENARIYTLPDEPPPILVSGFGPKATRLAARAGDGYMNVSPNAELLDLFRSSGGGNKPCSRGLQGLLRTGRGRVPQDGPSPLAKRRAPRRARHDSAYPAHFEQAAELVTEEMIAEVVPCGPDLEPHQETIRQYAEAGYDEVYVQQVGPNQEEFFDIYEKEILPEFR
jgi:G6PDH family F420-dependent oxidoreductase